MNIHRQLRALALCTFACLGIAACSTTRTTFLDDGSRGYALSCKGYLNSWQACLIEAGQICGARGYRTIAGNEYDRNMIITCKDPGAAK